MSVSSDKSWFHTVLHMSLIEENIQEFEARTATSDSTEQHRYASRVQHFSAINKFEGIVPSHIDKRLFQLLAAGKISKQEYIDLCLIDACTPK